MKRVGFNDYFNDNELEISISGNKKYVSFISNDSDSDDLIQINLSNDDVLRIIELLKENQ